jgi:hypothetical protein
MPTSLPLSRSEINAGVLRLREVGRFADGFDSAQHDYLTCEVTLIAPLAE